jgi:hypothetical protein
MKPEQLPQIFMSYAAMDRGWIEQLHRALRIRLDQMLGVKVSIWRDPALPENEEGFRIRRDLKASGKDEPPLKSLAALHEATALLCLVSPAYVQSERCRWELHEYLESRDAGKDPHIFKIMVRPVPVEEQPQPISTLPGYEFYVTDPTTGRTRELHTIFGADAERDFWIRLDDVAYDMAKALGSSQNIRHKRDDEFSLMQGVVGTLSINAPGTGERPLQVFLCHASDDKAEVKALYRSLVKIGVDPWLDQEKLLPGQVWEAEIPKAVKHSDAVVVCLSRRSLTKKGYVQKEIKYALDVADEHPEGALFLIPAKLEECEVPERLSNRQWVNLFEESGLRALVRALQARAFQLTVAASPL